LLGYDHKEESQASDMETLEIETLKMLGFPNPYLVG
jgi:ssRNA-specific RNase YbeY (16S rRNA maturation enzyme)